MVILEIRKENVREKHDLAKKKCGSPLSQLFSLMLFALMTDAGYIPVSVLI